MLRPGLLCTIVLLALASVGVGSAWATPAVDVKGTWDVTMKWAGGGVRSYQATYAETTKGGVVTGNGKEAGKEWPIKGGIEGLTLKETDGPDSEGYESFVTATIAADGNSYEGSFKDTKSVEGAITATRVGSEPKKEEPRKEQEPPKPVHGTGMTVVCNYDVLVSQDTCTATVADTFGAPTAPTGTVTFTSAGGGLFGFGPSCTLHSTTDAPSAAFCSVAYIPPAARGFPNISAGYAGDPTHSAGAASTRFIVPGGEAGRCESSSHGGAYPNELILEIPVPAPGTEVRAGVTKGATGASHPAPERERRAGEHPDIIPTMDGEAEEREREEGNLGITPSMRGEVEERAKAYEEDLRVLRTEIDEAKRHAAGLNAASQATENALVAGDLTVLAQIAQQQRSPNLKRGAADQLARLARQSGEIQTRIAEIGRLQHRETGAAVRSLKASFSRFSVAGARGKLIAVGYARRAVASGTIKLRIKLKRATLARLTRGKASITLNLRVSMVLPSHLVKGGVPVSSTRLVTLRRGSRRVH